MTNNKRKRNNFSDLYPVVNNEKITQKEFKTNPKYKKALLHYDRVKQSYYESIARKERPWVKFAQSARKRDVKDERENILSIPEFREYIKKKVEIAWELYGRDAVLSIERRLTGKNGYSYSDNVRDKTLICIPFRFNIGYGLEWSLEAFIWCSIAQIRPDIIKTMHDQMNGKDFNSAQSYSLGSMTRHEKRRVEKYNKKLEERRKNGEEGVEEDKVVVRDRKVFKQMYDKYKSIDQISKFFPLPYELNDNRGTWGEEWIHTHFTLPFKEVYEAVTGETEISGSKLHDLLKFSPERLNNNNLQYVINNTIPVCNMFQGADNISNGEIVDEEYNTTRLQQKWTPEVFKTTDFGKVAVHMQLCDSIETYNAIVWFLSTYFD